MFVEAREHDGFDPNTMFSQGVDLNEAYKVSPGMRRGVVAPGVDYQVDRVCRSARAPATCSTKRSVSFACALQLAIS